MRYSPFHEKVYIVLSITISTFGISCNTKYMLKAYYLNNNLVEG
jgi:hypothetical protein